MKIRKYLAGTDWKEEEIEVKEEIWTQKKGVGSEKCTVAHGTISSLTQTGQIFLVFALQFQEVDIAPY